MMDDVISIMAMIGWLMLGFSIGQLNKRPINIKINAFISRDEEGNYKVNKIEVAGVEK